MSESTFKKVSEGELLKWDKPGTKVQGILESYKEQKTAMGQGHVYEVQTKDEIVPFFAPSLLHKKLQKIGVGNVVVIEYVKKTKTGAGTDLKHFDVSFAPPTEANLKSVGMESSFKKMTDDEINPDSIDL